ncbi:MAG: hypothetical protein RMI56_02305 [Sulfolobales archaeon]|nr:hypothetical protein [Sulfolobales archaeon]MDW8082609.1 hypothetical protein [Sulfolobales archaeon]
MVQVRTSMEPSIQVLRIEDWRFLVEDENCMLNDLNLGWRVESSTYFLDMAELTYLIYKDLCNVYAGGRVLDLASLYSLYPQMDYAWSKFTVLLDLRERGRRARSGHSVRELLYTRGSERILVLVLEENILIEASKVIEWVKSAIMREYTPVIAVVDAHGDVTYYSASLARAEDLSRVYLGEDPSRTS